MLVSEPVQITPFDPMSAIPSTLSRDSDQPLAEQLDDETMRQLNAKVDVEHQNPTKVAAAFLRDHPMPGEVQP